MLRIETSADTLQAEGLALRCAERGGGLVFPSLWYGESRSESLMEANAADSGSIGCAPRRSAATSATGVSNATARPHPRRSEKAR
jgi:hypothetical protein